MTDRIHVIACGKEVRFSCSTPLYYEKSIGHIVNELGRWGFTAHKGCVPTLKQMKAIDKWMTENPYQEPTP